MSNHLSFQIVIGFLLEVSLFIFVGAVGENGKFGYSLFFLILGLILAVVVGMMIEESAIENYKRSLK